MARSYFYCNSCEIQIKKLNGISKIQRDIYFDISINLSLTQALGFEHQMNVTAGYALVYTGD